MTEIHMIGSGDQLILLRECAQACVDNGGDWYSPQQALSLLGDVVGMPALLADSAYIGMAKPECIVRLFEQQDALVAACRQLADFAERQGWFHVAINDARAAIAIATGEGK